MKKQLLISVAALGLFIGAGCANRPQRPLTLTEVSTQIPPDPEKLPMGWIYLLGKHVTGTPEITTTDAKSPYRVDIPDGFGAVGSGMRSMVCVSPDKASVRYFRRMNLEGAQLDFWRGCITKALKEYNGYDIVGDEYFKTTENLSGWRVTGEKKIEGETYRYKMLVIPYNDQLYMAELYSKLSLFPQAEVAFDAAIDTADIAFWRITHRSESSEPFFYFDPVAVYPKKKSGAWKPIWTVTQFGLWPEVQLYDSTTNVYGVAINVFKLEQIRVAGASLALCNAVKDSYGVQLGLFGATELNDGVSVGLFYNNVRVNNGLSLGIVNRAEHGSNGVQIGLLNFNSDPDYLSCLPIINFPIMKLFK